MDIVGPVVDIILSFGSIGFAVWGYVDEKGENPGGAWRTLVMDCCADAQGIVSVICRLSEELVALLLINMVLVVAQVGLHMDLAIENLIDP